MNTLQETQAIIYRKDGKEIFRLEPGRSIPLNFGQYVRYYQPFVAKGKNLSLLRKVDDGSPYPLCWDDKFKLETIRNIDNVSRRENKLTIRGSGSTYTIEYQNIDLERILKDGQNQGVNQ